MGKTTSYERGYKFELRVRKHLEKEGWWVIRSAQSRGLADLAAFWPGIAVNVGRDSEYLFPGQVMLIACRTDKARFSLQERQGLKNLARHLGHEAWLAHRAPGKGTKYALYLEEI